MEHRRRVRRPRAWRRRARCAGDVFDHGGDHLTDGRQDTLQVAARTGSSGPSLGHRLLGTDSDGGTRTRHRRGKRSRALGGCHRSRGERYLAPACTRGAVRGRGRRHSHCVPRHRGLRCSRVRAPFRLGASRSNRSQQDATSVVREGGGRDARDVRDRWSTGTRPWRHRAPRRGARCWQSRHRVTRCPELARRQAVRPFEPFSRMVAL